MWQKVGELRSLKALDFEKWEGSSLAALQKFTSMATLEGLGLFVNPDASTARCQSIYKI